MAAAQPLESEVLEELASLRAAARSDLRPTSIPLLVFGGLVLLAAALPDATFELPWSAYWLVAAPLGFAIIASRYRRIERTLGIGDASRHYRVGAVATAVLVAVLPSVALFFVSPLAGAGVALIVVSRVTHGRWVAAAGAVLLGLGLLEPWFILSNRVFDVARLVGDPDGSEAVFRYSRNVVTAAVGLALLGAGVVARRHGR